MDLTKTFDEVRLDADITAVWDEGVFVQYIAQFAHLLLRPARLVKLEHFVIDKPIPKTNRSTTSLGGRKYEVWQ